jgi:hypothetical protein
MLVPVGRIYRPALSISARPDLAAAFAQGEASRASGKGLEDEQQFEQLMGLSADARIAYRLGAGGPTALQAPAPLAVAVPLLLAEVIAEMLTQAPPARRHKITLALALLPAVISVQRIGESARLRRARTLGLTAETAPLTRSVALTVGQMVGRLVLVGIQQTRIRRRTGRWGRVSPGSAVAAAIIRELRLRQDWNAAYKHGQRSA